MQPPNKGPGMLWGQSYVLPMTLGGGGIWGAPFGRHAALRLFHLKRSRTGSWRPPHKVGAPYRKSWIRCKRKNTYHYSFNCSSNWPRLTGPFPLMSPGTDEAFLSIVGMSQTRFLQNGHAHYIASTLPVPYMESHMLLLKTQTQMKFSGGC